MKRDEEKCCGTCRWAKCDMHKYDGAFEADWICVNDQSDHLADWVEYDGVCEEWEGGSEPRESNSDI